MSDQDVMMTTSTARNTLSTRYISYSLTTYTTSTFNSDDDDDMMYTVGHKNVTLYISPYLRQLFINFQIFFTGTHCR